MVDQIGQLFKIMVAIFSCSGIIDPMTKQKRIMVLFCQLLEDADLNLEPLQVFRLCGIDMVEFHHALIAEGVLV